MSFSVCSKYVPGNIVLVRQLINNVDYLAMGIIRDIEAHCRDREDISFSYVVALDIGNEISVPESEILIQLDGYESLYRHSFIDFLRAGKGNVAQELNKREIEVEERYKTSKRTESSNV